MFVVGVSPTLLGRIPSIQRTLNCVKSVVTASSKARIIVKPNVSLIDEKVELDVVGLEPKQQLTLQAKIKGNKDEEFESFAHYTADEQGRVVVSSQPSLGGSYTGIEPMGLLWSMKPSPGQRRGTRLLKRDVTTPYTVTVEAFEGHLYLEGKKREVGVALLASETFEKWYMRNGVKRIPVREGRIRGTLFLPPGDGPFPGVVELMGTAGGLLEFKAALLASHGFAALALAYVAYDDLPRTFDEVELEYFEEAARMLLKHPCVLSHGVGFLGISKGSEIALMLAAHQSDIIRAIVVVSSPCALLWATLIHKGKALEYIALDGSKVKKTDSNDLYTRDGFPMLHDLNSPAILPVERIDCPVCLVYGTDDLSIDAAHMAECIQQRMEDHGKGSLCTVLEYPDAGHLIEPPYTPHCHMSYHKAFGITLGWGGEMKAHAMAQEDFWPKVLKFLRDNLSVRIKSNL